jgi:hypothetical protein
MQIAKRENEEFLGENNREVFLVTSSSKVLPFCRTSDFFKDASKVLLGLSLGLGLGFKLQGHTDFVATLLEVLAIDQRGQGQSHT